MIKGMKKLTLEKLYENLALEGGGAKGYVYLGMFEELEKLGIIKDIDKISGASVGAIFGLMAATGWSSAKITEEALSLDMAGKIKGGILEPIKIPHNLRKGFGIHKGKALYEYYQNVIQRITGNKNTTFAEWHAFKEAHPELGLKDLYVQACNVNTGLNETFSYESEHADVPIADAVRASGGFPFYFTAWKIKGCWYSDGGIQKNCPSDVFETVKGEGNPKTLSLRLDDQTEIEYYKKGITPPPKEINDILDFTVAFFKAFGNVQNRDFNDSFYKDYTVFGDTLGYDTLNFDHSPADKQAMIDSGKYAVACYFHHKHPELAVEHYDEKMVRRLQKTDHTLSFRRFLEKGKKHVSEHVSDHADEHIPEHHKPTPKLKKKDKHKATSSSRVSEDEVLHSRDLNTLPLTSVLKTYDVDPLTDASSSTSCVSPTHLPMYKQWRLNIKGATPIALPEEKLHSSHACSSFSHKHHQNLKP